MEAHLRSLDIGCGQAKKAGAVGVDINTRTDADVIADVSGGSLPFQNESFGRVWISHIIEHVESPIRLLEEIHRIGRDAAEVEGVTPHFSNPCSFADPTHRHHFSIMFLNFFREPSPPPSGARKWVNRLLECYYPAIGFYTGVRFEVLELELTFCRLHRWLGVAWLANRFPEIWEFHFSGIFRARDIRFRLRVRKGS